MIDCWANDVEIEDRSRTMTRMKGGVERGRDGRQALRGKNNGEARE